VQCYILYDAGTGVPLALLDGCEFRVRRDKRWQQRRRVHADDVHHRLHRPRVGFREDEIDHRIEFTVQRKCFAQLARTREHENLLPHLGYE
jgi:hypothetical protein